MLYWSSGFGAYQNNDRSILFVISAPFTSLTSVNCLAKQSIVELREKSFGELQDGD